MRDDFDSILFQFLVYYVSGCPSSLKPTGLFNLLEEGLSYLSEIMLLTSALVAQASPILQQCGADATSINGAVETLQLQACTVANSIYDVGDFLTCANWNSLYVTVIYEAVCYQATTGFSWLATTQFLIIFFSLIMLTLRVAFYEIQDEEEIAKQRRCLARTFCCCCAGTKEDVANPEGADEAQFVTPDDATAPQANIQQEPVTAAEEPVACQQQAQ